MKNETIVLWKKGKESITLNTFYERDESIALLFNDGKRQLAMYIPYRFHDVDTERNEVVLSLKDYFSSGLKKFLETGEETVIPITLVTRMFLEKVDDETVRLTYTDAEKKDPDPDKDDFCFLVSAEFDRKALEELNKHIDKAYAEYALSLAGGSLK